MPTPQRPTDSTDLRESLGRPGGRCARPGCEEPTPWDMSAVIITAEWYCSPECARAALDDLVGQPAKEPTRVALHDPQFHVDRSALPGVSPHATEIWRSVVGLPDAFKAVDELSELHPGAFRVRGDDEEETHG